MRIPLALTTALSLALAPSACAGRAAELQDEAGFVVTEGDDTVLVERTWMEGGTQRGRLTIGGAAHLRWRAEGAGDADLVEVSLWTPRTDDGAPRFVMIAERDGSAGS